MEPDQVHYLRWTAPSFFLISFRRVGEGGACSCFSSFGRLRAACGVGLKAGTSDKTAHPYLPILCTSYNVRENLKSTLTFKATTTAVRT